MKKSYTLLETIISISLFLILILFLYKTIDKTKHSNSLFTKNKEELEKSDFLHNIFLEDIGEATSILITYDKNNNSIIKLVSNNSFHNPFYNHITYLISAPNNLIRIESLEAFDEEAINQNFFDNSYIDILLKDIEYFESVNQDINYIFFIKQKSKKRELYTMYKLN